MLQADLSRDKRWEQVDLTKGIVFVTEKDGEPVQFIQARLMWQIEPLKWLHGKRKLCTAHEQKKATYLSIKTLDSWLSDQKNNPLIRSYFCFIKNKVMQKLATAFGMMNVYEGGKFFGRDF